MHVALLVHRAGLCQKTKTKSAGEYSTALVLSVSRAATCCWILLSCVKSGTHVLVFAMLQSVGTFVMYDVQRWCRSQCDVIFSHAELERIG